MFERMNWEEVYQLWKYGAYDFPQSLTSPLAVEEVAVEYRGSGYLVGKHGGRTAEEDDSNQCY